MNHGSLQSDIYVGVVPQLAAKLRVKYFNASILEPICKISRQDFD